MSRRAAAAPTDTSMKRQHDMNQTAAIVVGLATGEIPRTPRKSSCLTGTRNTSRAAASVSGLARSAALVPERRSEIAHQGIAPGGRTGTKGKGTVVVFNGWCRPGPPSYESAVRTCRSFAVCTTR